MSNQKKIKKIILVKITNIKLSGLLFHSFTSKYLRLPIYKENKSRISFYHGKLHFSILGKLKRSVNVTGVRNFSSLNEIQEKFSGVYIHEVKGVEGSKIKQLKVDSISLTCKTSNFLYRKVKKNSRGLRFFLQNNDFSVRTYITFPGICLKKIKSYAIIFFSTGTINGCGFKNIKQFYDEIKLLFKYFSKQKKNKIKQK